MRTLHFIPLSLAALALLVQAAPVVEQDRLAERTVQVYTTGNEAAEKQGALQNPHEGGGAGALGQLAQGLKNVKREDDDDDDEDDDDDDEDDDDEDDDDDDDKDDDDGDDLDDKDDDPDGNPNDDNDQLKKGGGGPSPLLGQQVDSLVKTLSPTSHGYHIAGIIKREENSVAEGPHIQKLKAHHHQDADNEDPGDGIHGDDDDDDDDDGDDKEED